MYIPQIKWTAKATSIAIKIIGSLLILSVLFMSGCWYGKNKEQTEQAKEQAKEAEAKVVYITKEVEKRIPEVRIIEKNSAELKSQVAVLQEKLRDAINNRQDNPSCDLTDDEYRLFQEAASKTRSP